MATNDIVEITSFKAVLKDGRIVTVDLKLSGNDIKINGQTLTEKIESLENAKIVWEIIE